jgi:LuxR family transcriptional regulator, maltose regulon positive regulatory protein
VTGFSSVDKEDGIPKAVSTLSWSAARETYVCVSPPSADTRALVPESPAWFDWLAGRSSFAFHGQAGSYTALLEAVQRGERYWYAYRRVGHKVRKKYLGKTATSSPNSPWGSAQCPSSSGRYG